MKRLCAYYTDQGGKDAPSIRTSLNITTEGCGYEPIIKWFNHPSALRLEGFYETPSSTRDGSPPDGPEHANLDEICGRDEQLLESIRSQKRKGLTSDVLIEAYAEWAKVCPGNWERLSSGESSPNISPRTKRLVTERLAAYRRAAQRQRIKRISCTVHGTWGALDAGELASDGQANATVPAADYGDCVADSSSASRVSVCLRRRIAAYCASGTPVEWYPSVPANIHLPREATGAIAQIAPMEVRVNGYLIMNNPLSSIRIQWGQGGITVIAGSGIIYNDSRHTAYVVGQDPVAPGQPTPPHYPEGNRQNSRINSRR